MDATPAAVWIAADPDGRDIRGSREAYELLRMPAGANLSKSPDNAAPTSHFRVFEEGVELSTEQLPVQRAARGEELRNFEEGHVRVSTQVDATDVHLIVTDTGIGIDPDFLTHIFDRFTQENAGFTREQGGLGLGLAIVQHIVTAHRGTVTVASAGKGQGAFFRTRLPRAADQGT
jgi:phosphoglycerate-specific signal transduction histidine kinase